MRIVAPYSRRRRAALDRLYDLHGMPAERARHRDAIARLRELVWRRA